MYILMVRLKAKQDHINDFIKASIADGTGSVLHEPGCRRFDIIQDETDPTLFAFNEIYNDEAAFEHHKTTPHFKQWDTVVKPMLDGAVEVSFCRPVYPLPIQPDKVDAFIAAVTLDGLGSTGEEPGCLRFDVYQNIHKPSELYLYEVYVNKAAFEYHTRTQHITT